VFHLGFDRNSRKFWHNEKHPTFLLLCILVIFLVHEDRNIVERVIKKYIYIIMVI